MMVMEDAMADGTWSVAQAKAKFSEVIEKARAEGPQHVTRNGKDAVVIVSAETWVKRSETGGPSFIETLLDPSVRLLTDEEADTLFARGRDMGRPIEL
jgi:prevent-host-death family protein